MTRRILTMIVIAGTLAATAVAATQRAPEDERRDAIRLLRAINTAENAAASRNGGNYLAMPELIDHPSMGGVKSDITVGATGVTYKDAQIRVALSADAKQYVVTVVFGAPNHIAAFTDERGVIYTGEALK